MARKRKGQKLPNFSNRDTTSGPGSRAKKLESYEDTLEPGSVDEHIFKRDQIMFNPQDESDDDLGPDGEEVLSLEKAKPSGKKARQREMQAAFDAENDEDEDHEEMVPKKRKEKSKPDMSKKGRFGKPVVSSDEEDEGGQGSSGSSGSGSDTDEERWGRQYYSRPSTRKEKEELRGEVDVEKREEEREMEVREVRRLQRKAREGMGGDDWGFADGEGEEEGDAVADDAVEEVETSRPAPVPVPETSDPAALIRHMQSHEPVKLALARDFPLMVHKLRKTAKGIKGMMDEKEGEESLHKGLGWLHYQTLLTYATTLALYIHLAALPPATRPDLATHPILARLLQLKEGVAMLEDLDFAAGSDSEGDPLLEGMEEDDEEDEEEGTSLKALIAAKKELMARMNEASGSGVEVMDSDHDDDDDDQEEEDEDDDRDLTHGETDESWRDEDLEEDELDDLLADAEGDGPSLEELLAVPSASKKTTKSKASKKSQESKPSGLPGLPAPLAEPAFYTSKKSKSREPTTFNDDPLGDPTTLLEADATDKERRTKSLRFHTSKIAATSARRSAARNQRLTGDEDVPYRDRQAARDAALRRNGPAAVGEPLGSDEVEMKEKKRARRADEEAAEVDEAVAEADGYYDLVKRRKTEKKAAKEAAHEERQAEKFASFEEESASGPRSLTRAIEKNRGLTPRRSKSGRNPRVKKRQAYEKAKQKVGSQRAVFKGGQASLGGQYGGEKTGISTVVKSRKF